MSLVAERQEAPAASERGFLTLINELPVGLVWLSEQGEVLEQNELASVLLETTAGVRIRQVVDRLVEACRTTHTCIQSTCELSGAEQVSVSVAPDRVPGAFLVVLDRRRLEKARTEASVLRAVLKAIASSTTRQDALRRALEAVHTALAATHLAFFELDAAGKRFACVATSGLNDEEIVEPASLENATEHSLLAAALRYRRPITMPDLSMQDGLLPFRKERGLAGLLFPVSGRSTRGVLYVSTRDALSDGLLRLCHALADAVGAVLDLATLEAEATRARQIAQQQERLATIGQLVAGVAHEINNPLAFLKSNLHSLRGDLDELKTGAAEPMAEVSEIVAESIEGVSRIETIVQALKHTARRKEEKIRFDPTRAVLEAVTIFKGAHKQECDIDATGLKQLPEVIGSPSALGQVALNLMQNGLDAMMSLERKRRRLFVSSRTEPGTLIVSFRDQGTGIPPEVQERMFDAFFTTKDPGKGTGLGLSICKEIAEAMGGHLAYTTGPDGTCFDLVLKAEEDD
ncbi:MAG: sensor histidine kinase [Myxococcota bacterium]